MKQSQECWINWSRWLDKKFCDRDDRYVRDAYMETDLLGIVFGVLFLKSVSKENVLRQKKNRATDPTTNFTI